MSSDAPVQAYQAQFHRRWNQLTDPHVRALAWLLEAPDLLDVNDPQWKGKVATLGPVEASTVDWLIALDRAPEELHEYLKLQPFTRLGRYAERLMAFYLKMLGILVMHGVQVRGEKKETIGEFDFIVRRGDELLHWEFASKFYLLKTTADEGRQTDYFVGPNLADTLGKKIRKIMDQQLSLSQHPAAQSHLPQPIADAQALVKGWLFYHGQTPAPALTNPSGISATHCCGFWCSLSELDDKAAKHCVLLPRLSWLAPAKIPNEEIQDTEQLKRQLAEQFKCDKMPVLIAIMQVQNDGYAIEVDRGFIVPDDWRARADEQREIVQLSG